MSAIVEYFEDAQQDRIVQSDTLFKQFLELKASKDRLNLIRRDQLSCCGARPGAKGEASLLILDKPRFNALDNEYSTAEARIRKSEEFFAKFDPIAERAQELGLDCPPTPSALNQARVEQSNKLVHAKRRYDAHAQVLLAKRVPATELASHPDLVSQEVEMAELQTRVAEIQAIVDAAREIEKTAAV